MTIDNIITQLDRISADSEYCVTDNFIELIINDFKRLGKSRSGVKRNLINPIAVGEVLDWLEDYADFADGDDFRYYYFDNIVVELKKKSL